MFNHYRDIRANGKIPEDLARVRLLSVSSWVLADEANFQINVIFINKAHIWSLNNYILT